MKDYLKGAVVLRGGDIVGRPIADLMQDFEELEASEHFHEKIGASPDICLWVLALAFPHSNTSCWSWGELEDRKKVEYVGAHAWLLGPSGYYPQGMDVLN